MESFETIESVFRLYMIVRAKIEMSLRTMESYDNYECVRHELN